MRDPFEYLKDRVEGRVMRKVNRKKAEVNGVVNKASRSVADKAEGAYDSRFSGKQGAGAAQAAQAEKKKKKMSWWPFGGDDDEVEVPACGNCGNEVDASWRACPHCGAQLGGAPVEAPLPAGQAPLPAGAAVPVPQPVAGGSQRTVAIDLSEAVPQKREVVGWLVVMSGTQKGVDFRIYTGLNNIGAAADNDIVVTDEYLSSRHSMIRYEDGRYELIDNGSTNGSFVNEKRINREELIDNDTIRLGRTELRFKALY